MLFYRVAAAMQIYYDTAHALRRRYTQATQSHIHRSTHTAQTQTPHVAPQTQTPLLWVANRKPSAS